MWDPNKLVAQVLDAATAQQVAIPDVATWPAGGTLALSASEYLADSFSAQPERLAELLSSGDLDNPYPDKTHMRQRVVDAVDGATDKADLGVRLRRIRRREMSRIAWRDLGGVADLDETLRDLSAFADAAISESLSRLDAFQQVRRGVPTDAEGRAQSLVVYALGKLGAGELNYSSDVDLIFAYPRDGETVGARRSISNHEYFVELGRSLIESLQRRSDEGFVFRVDMRLRPFGRDGPLAMSFAAMEDYYQHHGRDWERYALIRMRPVAGDLAAGQQLYERLTPFVFRRYLDFGTLESLREMKAMIAAEVTRRELDDHVKLGPGGIRELEFTVQAFQLVRGGRQPALRGRRVTQVLDELGRRELLPIYAVERLKAAYIFLRRVENRLQEFNDKQTHNLPSGNENRSRLATVMGLNDWAELAEQLAEHRDNVRAQFDQVLGGDESDHQVDPAGTLLLESQDTETVEAMMREFGFAEDVDGATEFVLRLRDSNERRSMDNTGARRLTRLLPDLFRAVATTDTPLTTLERVLSVITKILRRSTYLALLHERPITVSHFVQLCAASPWIANQIGEQPQLLDELLDARTLYQPPGRDELDSDMTERLNAVDEGDLEAELAALRQFRHRQVLRVAAADIAEALPLMKVSDHLTDIAEVVLERVMALAWRDIAKRHGVPRDANGEDAGFIIVAYGKLGGIELGYGSDLDIVFIHDNSTPATDGPRPVDSQVFFLRLAQRIVHYLTTTTPDGILYAVDTRLRPHGKDGMLACSLESFEEYQHEKAWTWEHQALLRTRAVAGSKTLAQEFSAARERVLLRARDATKLRDEVRDMRSRMRSQLDAKDNELFDLKQGGGGITDIEFMVQFAALRWADRLGSHLAFTDNIRLLEGLALAGVLSEEDAKCLDEAYQAYRERMHRLSLQELPGTVSASEFSTLRERVSQVWQRLMEDPTDC